MTNGQDIGPEQDSAVQEDAGQSLTTAADVESAGRSCVVIISMVGVILILLAIWVLYTTS